MKTYNNLYKEIYNFDNLHNAYLKARKCKRFKHEVLEYSNNLEENLLQLHNVLIHNMYEPSPYRSFIVKEPKERLILCLPFCDRVLHHAICNIIEPIFDKTFIKDSYACRKGKGVIAGVKRVEKFVNGVLKFGDIYCLKMDVKKYFYSINHDVLKRIIRKKIRCVNTLNLLDRIIDSIDNPGLPIGSLTSQLFANVYLNQIDHFIKEILRAKYYIRYMDDMLILSNNKADLHYYLAEITDYIENVLHLKLNNKTQIFPIKRGIDFLGYRQFKHYRILRKRVLKTNYKKFKKLANNDGNLKTRLLSFLNICSYCLNTKINHNLKNNIIGAKKWELMFSK